MRQVSHALVNILLIVAALSSLCIFSTSAMLGNHTNTTTRTLSRTETWTNDTNYTNYTTTEVATGSNTTTTSLPSTTDNSTAMVTTNSSTTSLVTASSSVPSNTTASMIDNASTTTTTVTTDPNSTTTTTFTSANNNGSSSTSDSGLPSSTLLSNVTTTTVSGKVNDSTTLLPPSSTTTILTDPNNTGISSPTTVSGLINPSNVAPTTATTLPAEPTIVTTVAASRAENFPFAGYQISIRPIINYSSTTTSSSGGNGTTAAPSSSNSSSTPKKMTIAEATHLLIGRILLDPKLFIEAFRLDIGHLLNVPVADIAVASVDRDPSDPTGDSLRIRFKLALVRSPSAQLLLDDIGARGPDSNVTSSSSSGNSTTTPRGLPPTWAASIAALMNDILDSNSTGLAVVGVDALWAAPDAQVTTLPPTKHKVCSSACFISCDCPGTIMVIASIVLTLICLILSIWQYVELKRKTEKEEKEHERYEKEVEARNEVREKLQAAGAIPKKGAAAAGAANCAVPAVPTAAATGHYQGSPNEVEMRSQPLLVQPQMIPHQQQQQQHQRPPMPLQEQLYSRPQNQPHGGGGGGLFDDDDLL